MFLPIASKDRPRAVKGRFIAADHDRQRRRLAPAGPPLTGASRKSAPFAARRLGALVARRRANRAVVDQNLARSDRADQAVGPEVDVLDRLGVGQAGQDDLRGRGDLGRGIRPVRAAR